MKPFVLFIGIFLMASPCSAQDSLPSPTNIRHSLSVADTATAIQQLEWLEKTYPDNVIIYFTNKLLGERYYKKGFINKSLEKRRHALVFKPTGFGIIANKEDYLFLVNSIRYPELKASICIQISELYRAQNNKDSSLAYLLLADNKYLAYQDCGNGILMYKSYLSFKFCDHYLKFNDTTSAIKRLLHYFLETDGNARAVTNKLKELLLTRISQDQLRSDILQAIEKSKLQKRDRNGHVWIVFKLYSETIHEYYDEAFKDHKKQLRSNRFISILLNDPQKNSYTIEPNG